MSELTFDSKKHEYKLGKKKLISATTFVKQFFEPFDVKKIAKIVARVRRNKGELNDKGKPINAWDVKREWKKSATDGTSVHKEMEDYIYHANRTYSPKALQGIRFLIDNKYDLDKMESEVIVNDDVIAGTIDVLYTNKDGSVQLIDWKTNKKIRKSGKYHKDNPVTKVLPDCNFSHYTLQLSLYAYILETKYGKKIDKLLLAHLMNNKYKIYEIEYHKKLIEEALEWHKRKKEKKE